MSLASLLFRFLAYSVVLKIFSFSKYFKSKRWYAVLLTRAQCRLRMEASSYASQNTIRPYHSRLMLFTADLDGTIFACNCCMRLAHVMSATRIVSSKSDVQHLHDSCAQPEKCHRILKHVFKPYDTRSHRQNVRMTSYFAIFA